MINLAPLAHLILLGFVIYLFCRLWPVWLVMLVALPFIPLAAGGLALVAGFGWVFSSLLADAEIWLFHALG